jgi:hypothetical protein
MDPSTINNLTQNTGDHITWIQLIIAVTIAAFGGGFFNPVWKYVSKRWKKSAKEHKEEAAVRVAEIKREEHTEINLWTRIEMLEKNLGVEVEKRLESEKIQNELKQKVSELEHERLTTLGRYIKLKLNVQTAQREIDYLKSRLRDTDPNFDKDYPKFTIDLELAEEKNMEKILNEVLPGSVG